MMSSRWVIIQVILRQLQREKHEETNDTEERGDIQGEKDSNRSNSAGFHPQTTQRNVNVNLNY